MSSQLFRNQALDYQTTSNSQFGKPTGVLPPSWSRITWLLALFIGALLLFLFNVDFARKETVRGKLRVDGAEAKIYALEPGIISEVLVEDGTLVEAGQPLFKITSDRYLENGESLSDETLASLSLERQTLETRKQSIIASARLAERAADERRLDAMRREEEARAQLSVVERRLGIAHDRAEDAEGFLEEGLIVEPQYNERLEAVAVLEQTVLQVKAQVSDASAAQGRFTLEGQQVRANLARDVADIDQRLTQIDGQLKRTEATSAHVVHAPISGRLTALQARMGEQAQPNIPLSVILPQDTELIAEAFLPSRAIGFVEAGQEVKLQYDAFPYQKFGVAYGKVLKVADTAQLPQEIGVPSQTGEPLYRIEIALNQQTIEAFSKDMPLQPGMELSADIVLENRRLVEWLLEPLRSRG